MLSHGLLQGWPTCLQLGSTRKFIDNHWLVINSQVQNVLNATFSLLQMTLYVPQIYHRDQWWS